MKRQREAHAIADKVEPRVARAFARSVASVRARVDVEALARAISARDQRAALKVLGLSDVVDSMTPMGEILTDSFVKGGRVGEDQVNDVAR